MSNLYLNNLSIPITYRNKRIYNNIISSASNQTSVGNKSWLEDYFNFEPTASGNTGNTINILELNNKLLISGNTYTGDFSYTGDTYSGLTGTTTFILGDLFVDGNIKASKDIIGYWQDVITENTLANLTVTSPLSKSGNTISLVYDTSQFELTNNSIFHIKDSVFSLTGHTHLISEITNLQTSLDGKQATITGAATTITSSNLTINRALLSDGSGKVAVSSITNTELGYLSGVTSNIQIQFNNKVGKTGNESISGTKTFLSTISGSIDGNAATATSIDITNDTSTDSTFYPTFVTGITGNLPAKVSSTNLTFNPLSGTLTSTIINGTEGVFTDLEVTNFTEGTIQSAVGTNLLKYSDDLTKNEWVRSYCNISKSGNNPFGGVDTANAVSVSSGDVKQTITHSTTGNYVFSVWLKAASNTTCTMKMYSEAQTAGTSASKSLTTTWQRFSITFNYTSAHTTKSVQLLFNSAVTFYVWGAQLETGTVEGLYIPTTISELVATRTSRIYSDNYINGTENALKYTLNGLDLNDVGTLTNVVYKGTLNNNYLPKYNGTNLIDSLFYDNGTNTCIGTTSNDTDTILTINNSGNVRGLSLKGKTTTESYSDIIIRRSGTAGYSASNGASIEFQNSTNSKSVLMQGSGDVFQLFNYAGSGSWNERLRIASSGNVLIGKTTDDTTNKVQISGSTRIDGDLHIEGDITASGEIAAYIASGITSNVFDNLTVNSPITKTGTTIGFDSTYFVKNDTDTYTGTTKISQIVSLSQTEYNNIATKSGDTLYIII